MDLINYLQDATQADPTWDTAKKYVADQLNIGTNLTRLIRGGWFGSMEIVEYLRLIGHCRVNVNCLLEAAEIKSDGRRPDVRYLTRAIESLGIMFCSAVVAVNLTTRLVLKSKPPAVWRGFFKEMMSSIEVGYKFGGKVPEIGPAGGVLIAFAEYLGPAVFLLGNPKAFKEWRLKKKKFGRVGRRFEVDLFGCESYQVSALALQQFGFGTEVAIGAAIGVGELNPQHVHLERAVLRWKAAQKWIEALRLGRDMPADLGVRDFFTEIALADKRPEKNLALSALYTEVAKVKSEGSLWTWHLPYPSYEKTVKEWGLEV